MLLPLVAVQTLSLTQPVQADDHNHPSRLTYRRGVPFIFGPVDKNMIGLFEQVKSGSVVVVSSPGGNTEAARLVAEVIEKKNLQIGVLGVCASACAEYILPSASKIYIEPHSFVIVHLNEIAFSTVAQEHGIRQDKLCLGVESKWLSALYERRGLSISFAKDQLVRLGGVTGFEPGYNGRCYSPVVYTKYDSWAPNSKQLKRDWGLTFEGGLCSDSKICIKSELRRNFLPGAKLVIGDDKDFTVVP